MVGHLCKDPFPAISRVGRAQIPKRGTAGGTYILNGMYFVLVVVQRRHFQDLGGFLFDGS